MGLPDKYKGATPGPWNFDDGGNWKNPSPCVTRLKYGRGDHQIICSKPSPDISTNPNWCDDALLIADAPMLACRVVELEELLRRVLPYAESRAEDLTAFKKDGQEDPEYPGAQEAWAAVREGYAALAANDNAPRGGYKMPGKAEVSHG